MTNVFLNEIWYNAEHIIFCGYSFPAADIHIKYLLKRIQTNKDNNMRFTVINNHTGKNVEMKNEERKRYKRFLGSLVDYTDKSFEDFSNNPETVIT